MKTLLFAILTLSFTSSAMSGTLAIGWGRTSDGSELLFPAYGPNAATLAEDACEENGLQGCGVDGPFSGYNIAYVWSTKTNLMYPAGASDASQAIVAATENCVQLTGESASCIFRAVFSDADDLTGQGQSGCSTGPVVSAAPVSPAPVVSAPADDNSNLAYRLSLSNRVCGLNRQLLPNGLCI
jgi:hypothetical protein